MDCRGERPFSLAYSANSSIHSAAAVEGPPTRSRASTDLTAIADSAWRYITPSMGYQGPGCQVRPDQAARGRANGSASTRGPPGVKIIAGRPADA